MPKHISFIHKNEFPEYLAFYMCVSPLLLNHIIQIALKMFTVEKFPLYDL